MSNAEVSVLLDLRRASSRLEGAPEFLTLWQRLGKKMLGVPLAPNQELHFTDEALGSLSLVVMSVPKGFQASQEGTAFAIHSVLEPPSIKHRCGVCAASQLRTHAPFACLTCQSHKGMPRDAKLGAGASPRLCEDHVVLLEGALRPYCPAHAPRCTCGAAALAWCFGRNCSERRGRAYCGEHVRPHPKVPDLYYCHRCYELEFPMCQETGCEAFGTIRCTHVEPQSEEACNKVYCSEHARRWQVYGPHEIGLGRCPQHSLLERLQDSDVIYQVAAGTEIRKRSQTTRGNRKYGVRRDWVRLPSLQAIGHILTKARDRRYSPREVNAQIEELVRRLDRSRPFQHSMLESLQAHAKYRQQNLERDAQERETGRPYFDKLVQLVRRDGLDEVADGLSYADFRPRHNLLFVALASSELRRHFIGARGHRIRGYEERLGVKISFEKGSES